MVLCTKGTPVEETTARDDSKRGDHADIDENLSFDRSGEVNLFDGELPRMIADHCSLHGVFPSMELSWRKCPQPSSPSHNRVRTPCSGQEHRGLGSAVRGTVVSSVKAAITGLASAVSADMEQTTPSLVIQRKAPVMMRVGPKVPRALATDHRSVPKHTTYAGGRLRCRGLSALPRPVTGGEDERCPRFERKASYDRRAIAITGRLHQWVARRDERIDSIRGWRRERTRTGRMPGCSRSRDRCHVAKSRT